MFVPHRCSSLEYYCSIITKWCQNPTNPSSREQFLYLNLSLIISILSSTDVFCSIISFLTCQLSVLYFIKFFSRFHLFVKMKQTSFDLNAHSPNSFSLICLRMVSTCLWKRFSSVLHRMLQIYICIYIYVKWTFRGSSKPSGWGHLSVRDIVPFNITSVDQRLIIT